MHLEHLAWNFEMFTPKLYKIVKVVSGFMNRPEIEEPKNMRTIFIKPPF